MQSPNFPLQGFIGICFLVEMGDGMSQETAMDLDLNEEPRSVFGTSVFNSQIEDRIRHLEAVTARIRQRQLWRETRNHVSIIPTPNTENPRNESSTAIVEHNSAERRNGRSCKRDSSYLVGMALEKNLADKKPSTSENTGSFYDCNICLDAAKDPILTCCGHLFCWACFYKVSYVDSASKECPVCKGEVTDANVTPIYGNGNEPRRASDSDDDVKVPPRPKARRVESVRQQNITQRGSNALNIPFAEAIRQIRTRIGGLVGLSRERGDEDEEGSEIYTYPETVSGGPRRIRRQVSTRAVLEVVDVAMQDQAVPPVDLDVEIIERRGVIDSFSSSRRLDGLARVVSNVATSMTGNETTEAVEAPNPTSIASRVEARRRSMRR